MITRTIPGAALAAAIAAGAAWGCGPGRAGGAVEPAGGGGEAPEDGTVEAVCPGTAAAALAAEEEPGIAADVIDVALTIAGAMPPSPDGNASLREVAGAYASIGECAKAREILEALLDTQAAGGAAGDAALVASVYGLVGRCNDPGTIAWVGGVLDGALAEVRAARENDPGALEPLFTEVVLGYLKLGRCDVAEDLAIDELKAGDPAAYVDIAFYLDLEECGADIPKILDLAMLAEEKLAAAKKRPEGEEAPTPDERIWSLTEIANAHASGGTTSGAAAALAKAYAIFKKAKFEEIMDKAFAGYLLATSCWDAGNEQRATEILDGLLKKGLALPTSDDGIIDKTYVVSTVATTWIQLGEDGKAGEAIAALGAMEAESLDSLGAVLPEILEAQLEVLKEQASAHLGKDEAAAAAAILPAAYDLAKQNGNPSSVASLAGSVAGDGNEDLVREILEASIAWSLAKPKPDGWGLLAAARAYADMGEVARALEIVAMMPEPKHRVMGLCSVGRLIAAEGRFLTGAESEKLRALAP